MSFTPILDLYINADAPGGRACILNGLSGSTRTDIPALIQGDVFLLRLHFRRLPGGLSASTGLQLDAGFGLAFAGKQSAEGDTLFSATSFTEDDTDPDDIFYESELSLTAAAIADALEGKTSITVICDVEVQADSNAKRLTYQFTATLRPQIYANELPPVLPGSELEIIGGVAYLERIRLKSSTGLYHEITLRTLGGTTVIDVEQTGASKP